MVPYIPGITEIWGEFSKVLIYFIGVLFVVLGILALAALNLAFGFNVAQLAFDVSVFLLNLGAQLWAKIVDVFRFDNKEQIFALAVIFFAIMVLMFMAMNLNASGTSGTIHIGSNDVSADASGTSGAGGYLITQPSITATTLGTVTSLTLEHCFDNMLNGDESGIDCGGDCFPCHCLNGTQDGDESDVDCGGSCYPCHCLNGLRDYNESSIDCGADCLPCSCSPQGVNPSCFRTSTEGKIPYCCDSGPSCVGHCTYLMSDIETARFFCDGGYCFK